MVTKRKALGLLVGVVLGLFGVEFSLFNGYVTSNRIAIITLAIILGPTLKKIKIHKKSEPVYVLLLLLVLTYTLSYLLNNGNGVSVIVSWVMICFACIMVVNTIDIHNIRLYDVMTGLLVLNLLWLSYVIFYSIGNVSINEIGTYDARHKIARSSQLPTIYNGILNSSFINVLPSIFYTIYYGEWNNKYLYPLIATNISGHLFLLLAGGSRQSAVTLLVVLTYTLLFLLRSKLKSLILYSTLSVSGIALLIREYYDWIYQRFYLNTVKEVSGQVDSNRLEVFVLSVNKIVDNLFVGVGPEPENVLPISTHNGFLQLYLSIGFIGGVLISTFILIILFGYARRSNAYEFTWCFLPSAIVIIFIISMFNNFLAHYSVWIYLSISTLSIVKKANGCTRGF
jgi:hypothetical protein